MNGQSGFTLGELMVSLAVAGITLSVGVPGFSDFIANQTQTNATNDLVTAMTLARSEAIKQNRYVTVCKSTNGAQCATGDNWNGGWIVFANSDQANAGTVDAGEVVIRSFQPSDTDRSVTSDVTDLNFVAFRPTGTVTVSTTWSICDDRGDYHSRAVFVDRAGRARAVAPDIPAAGNPPLCP